MFVSGFRIVRESSDGKGIIFFSPELIDPRKSERDVVSGRRRKRRRKRGRWSNGVRQPRTLHA